MGQFYINEQHLLQLIFQYDDKLNFVTCLHNSSKFLEKSIFEGSGGGGNYCYFKVILSAEVRGFVEVLKNQRKKIFVRKQVETFQTNVPYLYSLKTSEKQKIRGYRNGTMT